MDPTSPLVHLDLRGKRLNLERHLLMELPESILLCLFPNGVILPSEGMEEDELYYVDFDGDCLDYVLRFFDSARSEFYGHPTSALRHHRVQAEQATPASVQNPLFHKQAIIVLREELEYFAIPPLSTATTTTEEGSGTSKKTAAATDEHGNANPALMHIKQECGKHLLERRSIFTALQRNVNRENNIAEQHLIDMLCMSGFDREDEWGYRAMEPQRCCITSIALVLLKTGITHPALSPDAGTGPSSSSSATSSSAADQHQENGEASQTAQGQQQGGNVNASQLATAQKLLLFWRKPARKCWWDALEVDVPCQSGEMVTTKIHVRRIWTLELSAI